jgi:hypothetical protein
VMLSRKEYWLLIKLMSWLTNEQIKTAPNKVLFLFTYSCDVASSPAELEAVAARRTIDI